MGLNKPIFILEGRNAASQNLLYRFFWIDVLKRKLLFTVITKIYPDQTNLSIMYNVYT